MSDFERKKITNETKDYIETEIRTIYHKKISSPIKKMLLSKKFPAFMVSIAISILIITIAVSCIMISKGLITNKIKLVLGIFLLLIVLFVTMIIMVALQYKLKNNLKTAIDNEKVLNFYNKTIKNYHSQLTFTAITNSFTIAPEKFIPKYNTYICEKVLTGTYHEQNFNFGTIWEKIENIDNDEKDASYNRYLFLTFIIKNDEYVQTIKPENFIDRVRHYEANKLQSEEFEQTFSVDYSDMIGLRKLFQPQVMTDMVAYSKENKKIPFIYINKNHVTIMIPFLNLTHQLAPAANIINFDFNEDIAKTTRSIIKAINNDIHLLLANLKWLQILNLV